LLTLTHVNELALTCAEKHYGRIFIAPDVVPKVTSCSYLYFRSEVGWKKSEGPRTGSELNGENTHLA
jgi:hypothetical protein